MPGNAFIKFEPKEGKAVGESQQIGHLGTDGWIEIGEWSWDVEAESSHLKGTGASVGKPKPNPVTFSHYYDKSSPSLMQYIVKGTTFKTATIHMLKQTGKDQPELFFEMICKDVFITKVSSKGDGDGNVNQDVEFVCKQLAIGYKRQDNDGQLKELYPFRWNIAEQTQVLKDLALTIK
jgi:type VI secretion system secreted protein Hcp